MAVRAKKEDVALVSNVPLFSLATKKELKSISDRFEMREVTAGTHLTDEGKYGRDFFVVLSGSASCEVGGRRIRTFERGDFFGELALIAGGPRSATIIAETPMVVLALDRREFNTVLHTSPTVALKVLRSVASRLQEADHQVTD